MQKKKQKELTEPEHMKQQQAIIEELMQQRNELERR